MDESDLYDGDDGGDEETGLSDIEVLCDVFGEALVAYALAAPLDESEWGLMRMGAVVETDAVVRAVRDMVDLTSKMSMHPSDTAVFELLCRYDDDLRGSRINRFRSRCGVPLDLVDVSDRPVDVLLTILRDLYPALLLESSPWSTASNVGLFVRAHHLWDELEDAVANDTLADLCVERNDGRASVWTTGHETALRTDSIGLGLLLAAWERHALDDTSPSNWLDFQADLDALAAHLKRCVSEARTLAEGGSVRLPILFGMTDVRLDAARLVLSDGGDHVRHGGSLLLPPADSASPVLQHGVTATLVLYEELRRVGMVEEGGRLARSTGDESGQQAAAGTGGAAVINELRCTRQHRVDAARLAMVMVAGPPYESAPPVLSLRVVPPTGPHGFATEHYLDETPLLLEGVGRPPGRLTGPHERLRLSSKGDQTLRTCYQSIAALDESMHFGVRRLMSALTSRLDVTSGIVDGVMCWDNALGGRPDGDEQQHPTTKPLLKAVASAVHPRERRARDRLRNELVGLYHVRSQAVHGRLRSEQEAELRPSRTKVLEVAVRVIAVIAGDPVLARTPRGFERAREVVARVTPE